MVENTPISKDLANDPPGNRHRGDPPLLGQCHQTSRIGRIENHPDLL